MAASITQPDEESGPKRRPDGYFDPQEALEAVNSCNALSGARSFDLYVSYLLSVASAGFGREQLALASRPSGGGFWTTST